MEPFENELLITKYLSTIYDVLEFPSPLSTSINVVVTSSHCWFICRWSLGAIMYEMLVGYPPFYSDDPMSTCRKVNEEMFYVLIFFSIIISHLLFIC